ncbi:hypothetical protein MACH07_13030 [Flagellimonas marinaquae]|uniref:Uncharacterized protein n=1 Tax=Flagellimonas marinaquae TaxID=254955 RepID=A0AA48HQE0_9FLAO|nr:hypothetical protein MACH07_13030 [Allomuricauda aquimarina]
MNRINRNFTTKKRDYTTIVFTGSSSIIYLVISKFLPKLTPLKPIDHGTKIKHHDERERTSLQKRFFYRFYVIDQEAFYAIGQYSTP